ncbi:hypothetical protein ACQ4PT_055804 [Festuca glaucescens]
MVIGSASSPLLLRTYYLHGGNRKWLSRLQPAPKRWVPAAARSDLRLLFLSPPVLRHHAALPHVALAPGSEHRGRPHGQPGRPPLRLRYGLPPGVHLLHPQRDAACLHVRLRPAAHAPAVYALLRQRRGAAQRRRRHAGDERRGGGGTAPRGCPRRSTLRGSPRRSALYGFMLPVMELSQARHAARTGCAVTYTLVMEMQIVIGLLATAFSAVGMLVNNDFQVSLVTRTASLSLSLIPEGRYVPILT